LSNRFASEGVAIVDGDEGFLAESKVLFDGEVFTTTSAQEAVDLAHNSEIEVIFWGPTFASNAGLLTIETYDVNPDVVMVLVAPRDIDNETLRRAIRTGFRDIVEEPLAPDAVSSALEQATRLMKHRASTAVQPAAAPERVTRRDGKLITVMAAKGGSGKTVVATNVATLLARWSEPGTVAMVDANLQFGDVALVLQVDPKQTIVNAAKEGEGLDAGFLESVLTDHPSGMKLLAAPLEPAFADEVPTPILTNILDLMKGMFEYVVVDTAPALDDRLLAVLERSEQVLFVVDMDLPSIKNAKLALETLRILNFPSNAIRIILNRSNSKARLDMGEIERSLRFEISGAIPSDGLLPASINEGVPIVDGHPKSKPAKAFEDIAKLVLTSETVVADGNRKRRWF
jgi:pilus assembly protein CpaE